MPTYICNECKYSNNNISKFNIHLQTNKHKKNTETKLEIKSEKNIIIPNDLENKLTDINNQIEQLKQLNKQSTLNNNINTQKIIKETRLVKKSLLSILNSQFKDSPSIEYIKEDQFKLELEKEYKCKIDDVDCKLQLKILRDYENKQLINTLSKLIIQFIKKNDHTTQPVFNVDSSRGNYATKIDDIWHNDKSGLQLKRYTLDCIIKYMMNVLDLFRKKLLKIRDENVLNPSIEKSDYIMKYSTLLLEVNSYLTNPKTSKQVILFLCPELRFDVKLLELL